MFMRKWCAATAVAALLAFPLFGQQKDDNAAQPNTGITAVADASAPAPATAVHATRGVFALPAVPKTTPFPGPQAATKAAKDDSAPGQLVPRFELAVGYSYINFNPGDGFSNFNSHGANGGFTYNANRFLGLTAELGGYHFQPHVNRKQPCGGPPTYPLPPPPNLRQVGRFFALSGFLFVGGH